MNRVLDRQFSIKNVSDSGEFTGYGSVFGNIDSYRDVIEKGAFKNSLDAHRKSGTMPAMLWQHDIREPIGSYKTIEEDSHGLYVEGAVLVDAGATEKRAHEHLKAKTVTGLSIGFMVPKGGMDYDAKEDIWHLHEIDLKEISIVTMPANDQARIQTVKNFLVEGESPPPSEVEWLLRDAGFSRQQAKAFMSEGYKAISTRDADSEDLEAVKKLVGIYA